MCDRSKRQKNIFLPRLRYFRAVYTYFRDVKASIIQMVHFYGMSLYWNFDIDHFSPTRKDKDKN